jgi:hypothetical protein
MTSYQYSSLSEEAREIRLLTLLQATFSENIRIILHTASFTTDSTPLFEALSYTWGSSHNLISIVVGHPGHETLAITQNSYRFAISSLRRQVPRPLDRRYLG